MYNDNFARSKGDLWQRNSDDYDRGKSYKSGENLYKIYERNERAYAGDHWYGVNSKNLIPITLNFLEQLVDVKVSTIMANQLTIERKVDELDVDNEVVNKAAVAFQESDKKVWERVKMDSMNETGLRHGALYGKTFSHWYWDNELKTGNDFVTVGDIAGELVRAANVYVSNPNCLKIQKQDWIILVYRVSVKQAKVMGMKYGLTEDEIQNIVGDKEVSFEGNDKAYNEQASNHQSDQVTVFLRYEKDYKTDTILRSRHLFNMTLEEPINTKLKLYPVADMSWKERDSFFFALSELEFIIANQQHVNVIESLRGLHAKLQAMPITLYNKNMINAFTNQIGALIAVNATPGEDLSRALNHKQPADMGIDVDKTVETVMNWTRELKGINDNVTGSGATENKSAIVAQQRAAGVPLESIRRRFIQYLEDVGLIWLEFYKHYYTELRRVVTEDARVMDEEGMEAETTIDFTGADFEDVYLKTSVDVGANTQFTDDAAITILQNMLDAGHISPVQFLERIPKNILVKQQDLIEELGGGDQEKKYNMMLKFLEELGPEDKMATMELIQNMLMEEQAGQQQPM